MFRSYSRRLTKELDEDGKAPPVKAGSLDRERHAYTSTAVRSSGGGCDSEAEGGNVEEEEEEEGGETAHPSVRSPLSKLKVGVLKYGVVNSMARGRRSSDSTLVTSDMLRRRLDKHSSSNSLHPPAAAAAASPGEDAAHDDSDDDGRGRKRGVGGSYHATAGSGQHEVEEVDDDAMNGSFSDYKRGKRFRKLTKMLGSAQVGSLLAPPRLVYMNAYKDTSVHPA